MFDIQKSGTANRLTRPIAVIGGREAYKHLCRLTGLDPHNNDVFQRVEFVWDCVGAEFSRVLTIDGSDRIADLPRIVSAARAAVRN